MFITAHILRFVLILSFLVPAGHPQPAGEPIDLSYRVYLPLVSNIPSSFQPGNCEVVYQTPADYSHIANGATFTVRWIIRNTGENAWLSSSATIDYESGGQFHSGDDVKDLPYDVAPGGMLDWSISLTAPNMDGSYVSNWAVMDRMTSLCSFYIIFRTP